jgi:hypothetical protein
MALEIIYWRVSYKVESLSAQLWLIRILGVLVVLAVVALFRGLFVVL